METRKLQKSEWLSYFDSISKKLQDQLTYGEIRVLDPRIGAQTENVWAPLLGITYDHKDNLLEITVGDIDHMIFRPDEIFVQSENESLPRTIEVVHGEEKQVIELR